MAEPFNDLFHDACIHTMDGRRPIDKGLMRDTVKIFLSEGTNADLLLFKPLDNQTFEIKLHVDNELACLRSHSMGTIQDGKLTRLEAYEDAIQTYRKWQNIVALCEVKQSFEYFIELHDDELSLDGIGEHLIDSSTTAW